MIRLLSVIAGSILGTAAMSIYSYTFARTTKKQFREPVLLGALLGKAKPLAVLAKENSVALGWILHYMAGLIFTIGYSLYWERAKTNATPVNGMALGAANGTAGILILNTVFALQPNPPRQKPGGYSFHLMMAHVIFGLFTALGYRFFQQYDRRGNNVLMARNRKLTGN